MSLSMRNVCLLLVTLRVTALQSISILQTAPRYSSLSSSALAMARNRGLESRRETATPQAGGMTLYLKAGPDGKSVGDCPFAHFVRLTLEEKGLEYQLKPTTPENKPEWLLDHYEGKLPALRHYKECYVESDTICDYLDFFFVEPPLQVIKSKPAEIAFDGFFPAVAAYLKHTPDGDDEDVELQHNLEEKLSTLETHLQEHQPFLVDEQLTLLDLSLAPKLYHMSVGMKAFKNNAIDVSTTYPRVKEYMDTIFARDSFQKTVYPEETVVWGWSNAREGAAAKV